MSLILLRTKGLKGKGNPPSVSFGVSSGEFIRCHGLFVLFCFAGFWLMVEGLKMKIRIMCHSLGLALGVM